VDRHKEKSDWQRLSNAEEAAFRRERPAFVEVVRTALSTCYSRGSVAKDGRPNNASPTEIWRRSESEFAFVWTVGPVAQSIAKPFRVVGLASYSASEGVKVFSPGASSGLPEDFQHYLSVDFDEHFQASGTAVGAMQQNEVPAPTIDASEENEAPAPPLPEGPAQQDKKDPYGVIRRAIRKIDQSLHDTMLAAQNKLIGESALARTGLGETLFREVHADEQAKRPEWAISSPERRSEVEAALKTEQVQNFTFEANDRDIDLLERETPFYKNCMLFRLIDRRGIRSRFASFVLNLKDGDICSLQTKSPPIHEFNLRREKAAEFFIRKETALAYLRFFCEFVHGARGAFPVIEEFSEIRWLHSAPIDIVQAFRQGIESAKLWELEDTMTVDRRESMGSQGEAESEGAGVAEPQLFCRAFVGYGRYVFLAAFKILASPEMFVDEPVHEGELPVEPISYDREFQFELRSSAKAAAAPVSAPLAGGGHG
jgi:hypothetical protein